MAFEDTGLENVVQRVLQKGHHPPRLTLDVTFHAGRRSLSPLKVLALSIERHYHSRYADQCILECTIGLGTYNTRILPFKDQLTVSIVGLSPSQPRLRQYKAFVVDPQSTNIEGQADTAQSEHDGNLTDIVNLQLQLTSDAAYRVRTVEMGGIYRNVVPASVLRQVMTQLCQQLNSDQEERVYGVDMVTPDNTQRRRHVSVPQGTALVDLPEWLQTQGGGIYSTGLGFYLQDDTWYIYPEYNTRRFDQTPKGLTIVRIPTTRYTDMEVTYSQSAHHTTILASGDVRHSDRSGQRQMNQGNGIRFTDAQKVMARFSQVENNRLQVQRGENNHEYRAFKAQEIDNAPVSATRITANPFEQASQLALRQGAIVQLIWQHSDPTLLYPGQPVNYLYHEQGFVKTLEGILIGCEHYYHDPTTGPVSQGHQCYSALMVFVHPTPVS